MKIMKPRTELYILENGVQRRVEPNDADACKVNLVVTFTPGTAPHPRPGRRIDKTNKPEPPPAE